jgi:IS4 transposase
VLLKLVFCAALSFWLLRRILADNASQRQDEAQPKGS